MSKLKNEENRLSKLYDIKRYLNPEKYAFPEDMNELIPNGTPLLILQQFEPFLLLCLCQFCFFGKLGRLPFH